MPRSAYILGVGVNDLGWSYSYEYHSDLEVKTYGLWYEMLRRVYGKRDPSYKGCTVCERWKTLSNFASDIKKLPNYDKWKSGRRFEWTLDKDTKVPGNKCYSPDYCQFITNYDNVMERNNRIGNPGSNQESGEVVIEMNDGSLVETTLVEMTATYGISRSTASSWVRGVRKGFIKYGIKSIKYK